MSNLFWIIPSIVLGLTVVWLLGMWVVSIFKNNEWRDILAWIIVGANVLSLLSLGCWLIASQSNFLLQTTGWLILLVVVYAFVSIWAMY